MQKIRILHIIKSLGRGGAEMLLPETLKLHDRSKFEFFYIYFLPWKDQMVDDIKKADGKVFCFSADNNIEMLLKYKEVAAFCNKNKIDLIHCHLPWSAFLGRMLFQKLKIPVLYTEHNIQEKSHFATRWLNKISFNYQSFALGVSEDVTQSIYRNIAPKIPVKTVLNGVNTENFRRDPMRGMAIREQHNIPLHSIVIGNIAVFREQKSLQDWVRAFGEIAKKFPDVYGLLVGAGPKEKEIKDLVDKLDLKDKIKLPGLQTDTLGYFSAMDIFMMSSAFEGLPIALLEAMSMKCAIVSTKAGGVVEAVRDGKDGLLCQVGQWKELADLSSELILDEEKRKMFQEASRRRVEEAFSLKTTVRTIEETYLKLLGYGN